MKRTKMSVGIVVVLVSLLASGVHAAWREQLTVGEMTVEKTLNVTGAATLASNLTVAGSVAVSGTIDGVPGAANSATTGVSEVSLSVSYAQVPKFVMNVTDLSVPIINGNGGTGTNWTGGVKILDLAEGLWDIESVLVSDVILATNLVIAASEGGDWSLGTAIAAGDTLTGTAVDLCPATSSDTWATTNSGYLATGALFDGTATALDVFFNLSVDSGDISATTTATVSSATITIVGKQCGDD